MRRITVPQEHQTTVEEIRPHLGMSILGNECKRYLWYAFRWAYKVERPERIKRIFNDGNIQEDIVVSDLERWGYEIKGRQVGFEGPFKHILGTCDGIVGGFTGDDLAILEIKTMNDANFRAYEKKGVLATKPIYYAQVQLYMHFSGLQYAILIVVNKNTQERLYDEIEYMPGSVKELLDIGEEILGSEHPLEKIGGPAWYACKQCDAYQICQLKKPWEQNCRTCGFSEVHTEGKWFCIQHQKKLTIEEQRAGCGHFTLLSV